MALPRIREVLDKKNNVVCWNCKRIAYKYDLRYYPRIKYNAFIPVNKGVPYPKGGPDCPYCKSNLIRR